MIVYLYKKIIISEMITNEYNYKHRKNLINALRLEPFEILGGICK